MSNLNIGAKILLGFGVVIIILVIITGTVIFANSVINGAAEQVSIYNRINEAVNETYDKFFAARIYATRFNTRYSEEVWDNFSAAFEQAGKAGADGLDYINRQPLLSGYNSAWGQTTGLLDEYNTAMGNVRGAYLAA